MWCRFFVVTLLMLVAGCKAVPVDNSRGGLVVSRQVAEYFEDEEVDQLIAGQGNDIRCVRERRVGTHLVTRICRTKSEWADLHRQTQDAHRRRLNGPCGATSLGGGASTCGEGRGGN